VTDLELLALLNEGKPFASRGFAVVSLTVPFSPPIPNWNQGEVGWKLLAEWIPAV
jgi:hypothetical protein